MTKKKELTDSRPIWAPWRIEYIKTPKDSSCFLCGNDKKSEKNEDMIIHRGKKIFVILNTYPYNSGHLMIAPFRHIASFSLLNADEKSEIFELISSAEKTLKKVMNPDGFNIGFNIGKAAGAGIEEHVHLHVVPRWLGDNNFMPVLANTRVIPQALSETASLLKKNWLS